MTKEEFIESWVGGTMFPENLNSDLDLLMQQAIAEHEQKAWKWFNIDMVQPVYGEIIIIQFPPEQRLLPFICECDEDIEWFDGSYWAYFTLPAPYQEGGDG